MDVALIIERLLPATIYSGSLTDNTQEAFDALTWNDERTKPSWQAILDELAIYTKNSLFAYLASYRYTKENGGISLGGLLVRTDDRSKTLLSGKQAKAIAEANPTKPNVVKLATGFTTLTNQQLIGIFLAVADHVQKCFDAEAVVFASIDNNTITTFAEIGVAFDAAYSG